MQQLALWNQLGVSQPPAASLPGERKVQGHYDKESEIKPMLSHCTCQCK